MSAEHFDYAILGGGCAGLSLAVEMLEQGVPGRILLVEPRTSYRRDRTWCFWGLARHAFEDAVAHRWSRWAVRHEGREIVHASARHPYCEIHADAFYASAFERLRRAGRVELLLGAGARALEDTGDGVRLETDAGTFSARLAFDSRPARGGAAPDLLQHFIGLRVRTETPVFDPGVVTLMDFDVSQADGIHFAYVLPYDRSEALVESTFFSPRVHEPQVYRAAIEEYLDTRFGVSKLEVLDAERGAIPMDARPIRARVSPHVLRIGTPGGLVRPSTGYAFLAIQRASQALARSLRQGRGLPDAPPRSRVTRALDAIFLAALRRHPERAPALFEGLFQRVPADRVVRFLSDAASPLDRLSVVAAMPTAPFLREAWRSRAQWIRA